MRRLGIALILVLAVVAGVASASAVVGGSGEDTTNGPEAVQPDGSGSSLPTTVADPDGGAQWGVRVYRSQTGLICPEAGRIQNGSFGRVDDDGQFTPLDVEAAGACADLSKAPMSLAINHFPASGTLPARAVLFGVVATQVTAVALKLATGTRALPIARGAFITVTREEALQGAELDATLQDGSTKSYALRPISTQAPEPADPQTG